MTDERNDTEAINARPQLPPAAAAFKLCGRCRGLGLVENGGDYERQAYITCGCCGGSGVDPDSVKEYEVILPRMQQAGRLLSDVFAACPVCGKSNVGALFDCPRQQCRFACGSVVECRENFEVVTLKSCRATAEKIVMMRPEVDEAGKEFIESQLAAIRIDPAAMMKILQDEADDAADSLAYAAYAVAARSGDFPPITNAAEIEQIELLLGQRE